MGLDDTSGPGSKVFKPSEHKRSSLTRNQGAHTGIDLVNGGGTVGTSSSVPLHSFREHGPYLSSTVGEGVPKVRIHKQEHGHLKAVVGRQAESKRRSGKGSGFADQALRTSLSGKGLGILDQGTSVSGKSSSKIYKRYSCRFAVWSCHRVQVEDTFFSDTH